jgi:hypothetical protein
MKMEQRECSETSAYKFQTPGNYPKEYIQHLEHGETLKSRTVNLSVSMTLRRQGVCSLASFFSTWLFLKASGQLHILADLSQ